MAKGAEKQEKNTKVINRATGKEYMVTADDAEAIRTNKHTKSLYSIESKASLPEMAGKIKAGGSAESTDEQN